MCGFLKLSRRGLSIPVFFENIFIFLMEASALAYGNRDEICNKFDYSIREEGTGADQI